MVNDPEDASNNRSEWLGTAPFMTQCHKTTCLNIGVCARLYSFDTSCTISSKFIKNSKLRGINRVLGMKDKCFVFLLLSIYVCLDYYILDVYDSYLLNVYDSIELYM